MPVPTPRPGESQQEFISRCMSDPIMVREYEPKQRAAICYRQWRESGTQQHQGAESTARRRT